MSFVVRGQPVYDVEVFASNDAHIDDKVLPKKRSFDFITASQPDAEFEPPAGRTLPRQSFESSGSFLVLSSLPHLEPERHQDSMHRCVRLNECEKTTVQLTNQCHKFPTQSTSNDDAKPVEVENVKPKYQDLEFMFEPRSDDAAITVEYEKNCLEQVKKELRTTWVTVASRADGHAAIAFKTSSLMCYSVIICSSCPEIIRPSEMGDTIYEMCSLLVRSPKFMMFFVFCIAIYRLKNPSPREVKPDRQIPRWFGFVWANNIKAKPFTRRLIACY